MINKRIALFICSNRDINTYPTVTNAIRLLSENGYNIDVFINTSMKTYLELPYTQFIVISERNDYSYVNNSLKYIKDHQYNYNVILVFDFDSLIISYLLNRLYRNQINTIYFSLELIYRYYFLFLIKKIVKNIILCNSKEIKYSILRIYYWIMLQLRGDKFIKFSVIQDIDRGRLLRKEFRFVKKIYYLPNSYIGYCDDECKFAYERFNVLKYKKILIFAGGIEKGFDLDLFEMCGKLPAEYILFLNAYSRDNYLNKLIIKYKHYIDEGKLFINSINLSEEDYDKLIKSSYIGIVWYQKEAITIPNIYYIGLSSGKLTKYLSCGKPVIATNHLFSYSEFIEGNQLGKTCEYPSEIPSLVEIIDKNYKNIQENIKKFYLKKMEYKKFFYSILNEIENY